MNTYILAILSVIGVWVITEELRNTRASLITLYEARKSIGAKLPIIFSAFMLITYLVYVVSVCMWLYIFWGLLK